MRRVVEYTVAALTFLIGAGSLLLFGLFLWSGAFRAADARMSQTAILAWDAGLCLLFFVQHSGMVRKSFRAWIGRAVPAHLHGMVYTIASGAALFALVEYWQPSAMKIYALGGAASWLMRAVLLLALAGFGWAIGSLKEFDAFGIQAFLSRFRGERLRPSKLSVKGPYRLVRHPFYFFGIVALWASPVLSIDRLVFNSLFTAWIVTGAWLEERDLLAEFGEDYRIYQRQAPMLIPWRGGRQRRPVRTRL